MHESIFTVSAETANSLFWESVPLDLLVQNAEKYKEEIRKVIKNWEIQKILPRYKQLNATSLFHQAKVYLAFWDKKRAIECFKKSIATWEKVNDSLSFLEGLWCDIWKILWEIKEVSLEGWRMIFQKWEEFEVQHFYLNDIDYVGRHLDFHWTSWNPTYHVISLSQNDENWKQAGKFNFLATPYHSIDDWSHDWFYLEPEDLDTLIHPISTIFIWINGKWELEFEEINTIENKKVFTIWILEAQKSLRVKWDVEWTWEEQDYLVWEQWNSEVVAITYWENHPKSILKELKEY